MRHANGFEFKPFRKNPEPPSTVCLGLTRGPAFCGRLHKHDPGRVGSYPLQPRKRASSNRMPGALFTRESGGPDWTPAFAGEHQSCPWLNGITTDQVRGDERVEIKAIDAAAPALGPHPAKLSARQALPPAVMQRVP